MILVIMGSLKIGKLSILNVLFSAVDKVLKAPQYVQNPHYSNHDFSPLVNCVYIIAIINKTTLYNGNCPITKMGVAHTTEHYIYIYSG